MRASASAPALHDAGSKHVDGRARRGSVGLAGGAAPGRARRGSVGLAGAPTAGHARRGSIGVPGASEGEGRRQSVVTGVDDPSGALRAAAKIGTRRKSVVEDSGALAAARQLGEERGLRLRGRLPRLRGHGPRGRRLPAERRGHRPLPARAPLPHGDARLRGGRRGARGAPLRPPRGAAALLHPGLGADGVGGVRGFCFRMCAACSWGSLGCARARLALRLARAAGGAAALPVIADSRQALRSLPKSCH